MLPDNPIFRSLDSSLSELIPSEPVEILGEWSTKTRKMYQSEKQMGSGDGPFVEVEDRRWLGTLTCRTAASAITFLITATKVYWAKAPTVALTLPVTVSLHAYTGYLGDRATFTAGMGGAVLPSVPVTTPARQDEVCTPGPMTFKTGRVVTFAHTDGIAFVAVVLPGIVLKMGRKHLWRLRDEVASSLTQDLHELLTRRRSGEFNLISARHSS